jgi:hypothetical protein
MSFSVKILMIKMEKFQTNNYKLQNYKQKLKNNKVKYQI